MTISKQVRRAGEAAGTPPAIVTLEYETGSLPLPVHPATEGPSGLDVSKLLSQTGHVTPPAADPGEPPTNLQRTVEAVTACLTGRREWKSSPQL